MNHWEWQKGGAYDSRINIRCCERRYIHFTDNSSTCFDSGSGSWITDRNIPGSDIHQWTDAYNGTQDIGCLSYASFLWWVDAGEFNWLFHSDIQLLFCFNLIQYGYHLTELVFFQIYDMDSDSFKIFRSICCGAFLFR